MSRNSARPPLSRVSKSDWYGLNPYKQVKVSALTSLREARAAAEAAILPNGGSKSIASVSGKSNKAYAVIRSVGEPWA